MDAQRIEVLHITDRDAVVETIPHHFIFHFFPPLQALFHQHLGREREGFFNQHVQFFLIVAEAGTETAQCISSADNHRIAQPGSSPAGIFGILHRFTLDRLHTDLIEFTDKEFTVFRIHDRLYRSTEHTDVIFFQHSTLVKRHTAVQCRLAAKSEQDTIRTFLSNHLFDEKGSDRQEINSICHSFRSLYRGDVRIDKHCLDSLLLNSF